MVSAGRVIFTLRNGLLMVMVCDSQVGFLLSTVVAPAGGAVAAAAAGAGAAAVLLAAATAATAGGGAAAAAADPIALFKGLSTVSITCSSACRQWWQQHTLAAARHVAGSSANCAEA